jgi:hypothetical protein
MRLHAFTELAKHKGCGICGNSYQERYLSRRYGRVIYICTVDLTGRELAHTSSARAARARGFS